MTTDWILIRRAAAELERALGGGRVVDLGLLEDGRIAVRFGGLRGQGAPVLAIDAFGSPPLVTVEDVDLAVAVEPGWLRTVSTTLRGTRLRSVRARSGDRVAVLSFGASSRFGIDSEFRLVLELVPRYGNVVLLRDRLVIASAKQFSPSENETRAVQAGLPYEPPPLPEQTLDFPAFTRALEHADRRARVRALGAYLPVLPRLLAESVVVESEREPPSSAARLATQLEDRARALLTEAETRAAGTAQLVVYRDAAGSLAAAHLVPLAQYADVRETREPQLLPLFAESRLATLRAKRGDATERKRATLRTRIEKRVRATEQELDAVSARIMDAASRDRLRESGDALYTHALEVPGGAASFVPSTNPSLTIALDPELDPKENAKRYYVQYRKATDALPHLERRRESLHARREALEVLAFEVERADSPTLSELEADLDELEGRAVQRRPVPERKRQPLRVEQPSGARIYVGRSPRENADVTFRIARPDDLWFHARGVPGSHVVLQLPNGAPPNDADLDAAANLAATHSKARNAPRVEVDYTERKYVRKQRDGAPGLVWYVNARTRIGRPSP